MAGIRGNFPNLIRPDFVAPPRRRRLDPGGQFEQPGRPRLPIVPIRPPRRRRNPLLEGFLNRLVI